MPTSILGDLGKATSTALFVKGVIACLFGVVAMAWPLSTAVTLVIIWGVYALVDGVTALAAAFQSGNNTGRRGLEIIIGIIGIAAGLIAIFQPISSAVALTWLIGIWLIVRGILEIAAAFGQTARPRWLLILGGALWILAGVIFVANPGSAAVGLALWIGIIAFAWGVLFIGAGFTVRSATKQ